jgi:hypothetical protein
VKDWETPVRQLEAECREIGGEMLASCRAASGRPIHTIRDFGHGDLTGVGAELEKLSKGTGVSAGCAKATLTYFGMYGPLVMEATARMTGQQIPQGGLAAMLDSWFEEGSEEAHESGDNEKHWTQVAALYSLVQLYGEANAFNTDFDAQLIQDGTQPLVSVLVRELQQLRRNMQYRLQQRYSTQVELGIKRYGPPTFSEK